MALDTNISSAEVRRDWFVVDASGEVLGRLATRVARVLSGKHRATFVPYLDTGDFVVVTERREGEADGRQERFEGLPPPHGLSRRTEDRRPSRQVQEKHPERIIEEAVRGMLPKTKLGRKQFKKLKVYRGAKHPHEAQQPRPLKISAARGGQVTRRNFGSAVDIQHRAVGRRKTSMARVRLSSGNRSDHGQQAHRSTITSRTTS